MKKILLVLLLMLSIPTFAQSIEGSWEGKLQIPGSTLTLRFHFNPSPDGWSGTMDSPDQGAYDIPLDKVTHTDGQLIASISQMQLTVTGDVKDDAITGTFKQGGATFPIELHRTQKIELNRPQTPQPPYTYNIEEVSFASTQADITLSGTLTLPNETGKYPAIILIAGSGPLDRDESLMQHKPFAVLADFYTKHGFAVLRYDKRGVGKSTGNYPQATTYDFAKDVEGAFKYLSNHPNIQANNIGLIGHSEGGIIAPIVASTHKSIKFIVLLAAPGLPGNSLLKKQNEEILQHQDIPNELKTKLLNFWSQTIDYVANHAQEEDFGTSLKAEIDKTIQQHGLEKVYPIDKLYQEATLLSSPWFVEFLQLDPADYLKQVTCPVFAINGENDIQVDANHNLKAIQRAVKNTTLLTTKKYPKLNHLFQSSDKGTVDEYVKIEETFSEQVMKEICTWITSQTQYQ